MEFVIRDWWVALSWTLHHLNNYDYVRNLIQMPWGNESVNKLCGELVHVT